MSLKHAVSKSLHCLRVSFVALMIFQFTLGGPLAAPLQAQEEPQTKTPIKHVIVIIGENRTFDHIFATYKPKDGENVDNLWSKGIVREDGTPGPNSCWRHSTPPMSRAAHCSRRAPASRPSIP